MLLNANKGHNFIDSTYDFVPSVALLFFSVLSPVALSLCLCDSKSLILLFCLSRSLSVAGHPELFLTKLQCMAVESQNYHGYHK